MAAPLGTSCCNRPSTNVATTSPTTAANEVWSAKADAGELRFEYTSSAPRNILDGAIDYVEQGR